MIARIIRPRLIRNAQIFVRPLGLNLNEKNAIYIASYTVALKTFVRHTDHVDQYLPISVPHPPHPISAIGNQFKSLPVDVHRNQYVYHK